MQTYRWRQKCNYHEKESAGLPLQLTAVSPWPNEILEGSAQPGGAEVNNTAYETSPVHVYGECVSAWIRHASGLCIL